MPRKDIPDTLIIRAVSDYWRETPGAGPDLVDRLEALSGEPAKVCLRALERAQDRGLIDCGSTIQAAWLTEAGHQLLSCSKNPSLDRR